MKLTADTITDDQIKALLAETEAYDGDASVHARLRATLCRIALGTGYTTRVEARARCAEIINAREGGV